MKTAIYNWDKKDLLDFSELCQELLPTANRKSLSVFEFNANSQLSGLPRPCVDLDCRLQNVNAMARFATLYAERILLRNPFEDYYVVPEDDVYERITDDLTIIYHLKPLLEAGLVSFVESPSSRFHFCLECYERAIFNQPEYGEKLEEIQKSLKDTYIDNADFFVEKLEDTVYIFKENISPIVDDNSHSYSLKVLSRGIEKKLKSSSKIKLSKRELLATKIIDHFTNDIIDDIAIQNWCSNIYGTNYLTNRQIDLEMISSGSKQEILHNKSLIESFSHYLPLFEGNTIESLIQIRKNDGESFLVYRDALKQALQIASKSSHQELSQIFNDIVQPEINKINNTVKKRRKTIRDSLFEDLILSAGFVSIGVFNGFLPPDISHLLTALGGFKFISSIKDKISSIIQEPENITNNKFYFLWKAQKNIF